MKKDFILPDIGEGIVECEVIEWKVKEGDLIEEDQIIVDVSTDKAIVEIPSMYNGKVDKLYYGEGDIAKVHEPLFGLEIDAQTDTQQEAEVASLPKSVAESSLPPESSDIAGLPSSTKVLTTPVVRKMAREYELDLTTIKGTGKQGRILKEDILAFLAKDEDALVPKSEVTLADEDRVEPIKGVGKIMAVRMSAAVATIPHFSYVDEMDVTDLIQLRQSLVDAQTSDEFKITLMPLFIKALSLAIKQFPIINSRADEDFTELTFIASHNIGMAVDGKTGLLVPNIKNVQHLSLLDIAREVTRLTAAARSGKINPQDLSGGTITISNIGAIGGTVATPIINKPEVAIVALGKIQSLPRFDDQGNIVSRKIMTVSWSGDHRVIDGGTIARFNNLWMGYLQHPATMLAAMI